MANNKVITLKPGQKWEVSGEVIKLPSGYMPQTIDVYLLNGCPYCGTEKPPGTLCCGEVHDTELYETETGEVLFKDELTSNHRINK